MPSNVKDRSLEADAYIQLQQRLGYHFRNLELLSNALTHRSFGTPNNERLEFVGDSVVNLCVGHLLYSRYPEQDEGGLSRLRANLVSQNSLALVAKELGLGAWLRMSSGELRSGGKARDSILADALEAVLGAIYLESGFEPASRALEKLLENHLNQATLGQEAKDAKSRLQELLQARQLGLPRYTVSTTKGSMHQPTFEITCQIPTLQLEGKGSGSSRRRAEQAAAEATLQLLSATTPAEQP